MPPSLSLRYFNGLLVDGTTPTWTTDPTIAVPVWSFPLMTSVQQANYHAGLDRYIFANWAWISYDGPTAPCYFLLLTSLRYDPDHTFLRVICGLLLKGTMAHRAQTTPQTSCYFLLLTS